jgi:hypothetical protein
VAILSRHSIEGELDQFCEPAYDRGKLSVVHGKLRDFICRETLDRQLPDARERTMNSKSEANEPSRLRSDVCGPAR